MIVLGINYHHPDSSACLIKDGQIIAAAEEERFTRIKHFAGFPKHSIDFCLKYSNVNYSEINYVALNFNSNSNIKEKLKYSLLNIHKISTLKKIYNQKNKFKQQNQLSNFFKKKILKEK